MSTTSNRTIHGTRPDSAIQTRLKRIESLLTEIKTTTTKPLDLDETATYLHHSKSHVYKLTSRGLIAHFKPNGKKIYFLKQDLDAYLLRNRRSAIEEIDSAAASHIVNYPAVKVARKYAQVGRKNNE